MSLQFSMEESIKPLVSLSYQTADEDMEKDSISVTDGLHNQDSDDEFQVIACYRENAPFPNQLVAGRATTTEQTNCLNELSLQVEELFESISTFTEHSQDLLEWCVGGPSCDS